MCKGALTIRAWIFYSHGWRAWCAKLSCISVGHSTHNGQKGMNDTNCFNRRSGCQTPANIPLKMEFWISLWFIQKHNQNEAHNPNISSLDPSQAEIPTGCTPISGQINPPYQGSTNSDFDKNQNLCFIWSIFWEYIIKWTVLCI